MPISRDARMDRRRRFLRESVEGDETREAEGGRRQPRRKPAGEARDTTAPKRAAGYSQDVRRACGQRLVQLIPVRRRSFAIVTLVSLLVPTLLLVAHYMIYVTGQLPWYGHPLALAFDASHPRSIAAWLSSHLWLLCLGATVLTWQLRRHKLDDYTGEYRLWFWLVLTCLVASLDATTNISELFGLALDRWSQVNLGWSGPAVVDATLAVLIGMLGLRLCSELKVVPLSLVFWLSGLVAWAASAALGREELKIELSVQMRIWLASGLWLGGLTAIWLAALAYLRSTYVEAQRRFLLRGGLALSSVPLRQRLRDSLPSMPAIPKFGRTDGEAVESASPAAEGLEPAGWRSRMPGLPRILKRAKFLKRGVAEEGEPSATPVARRAKKQRDRSDDQAAAAKSTTARQANLESTRDRVAAEREVDAEHEVDAEESATPAGRRKLRGMFRGRATGKKSDKPAAEASSSSSSSARQRSRLGGWLRRAKDNDEAEEYHKLPAEQSEPTASRKSKRGDIDDAADQAEEKPSRRRLPKLSKPKLPRASLPTFGVAKLKGLVPKIKLPKMKVPKFKLPSLRLPPPGEIEAEQDHKPPPREVKPVSANRTLPSTNPPPVDDYEEDGDNQRSMSKAERKRLRRQQQNRDAA